MKAISACITKLCAANRGRERIAVKYLLVFRPSLMRFSEGFVRQVRERVSIAQYAGSRLQFDKRKSRPAAGDYWACCPFHQEKSASFHILDGRGVFKCFGCGESGDVITLAMQMEGLSFPEAVEQLAERGGIPIPREANEDRGENDRRKRLYTVTAHAAKLFGAALHSSGGAEARRYLQARGLGPDEWTRFGIGFAPDEWTWTLDKLKSEGFSVDEIVTAGVARTGEDGKRAIDTFRGRVTFEIGDTSGKTIGFGGRLLDANAKAAKYINSPETPLYSKSRVLYRLKQARELLAKTRAGGLVVAEGYLDVIAFERAGIAAVAPCGTAVTDEQVQLIWRAGAEPVLCFDGDSAGQRAAERALDLVLPHFSPERTVRIAYAPQGQDPDDIYRQAGAEGLAALIAAALPASDALFARELNRRPLTTPEARAALQAALREAANKIVDRDTQRHYFTTLMARANEALRPPRPERGQQRFGKPAPEQVTPELKALSSASRPRPAAENFLRAAADCPDLLLRYGDWLERLDIADPDLEAIRAALLDLAAGAESLPECIDRSALSLHLTRSGRDRALARLARWPKPAPIGAEGGEQWLALATLEVVAPAIREELAELHELAAAGDDAAFARFQALRREARDIEARARAADNAATEPSDDLVP
jgi:DNA primase